MGKLKPMHPIFDTANFTIVTPEMESLQETIIEWTRICATGGFISGSYRIGKTRAIRAIADCITNHEGEKVHAVKVTVPARDKSTVANIFRILARSMGLKAKVRSNADEMADLVLHSLCELASFNSSRQVVLFVDEMHRLSINQIEAFAEIHDLMSEAGFNSCIIFIGNSETSRPLLQQIKSRKYELIRGRFFTRRHDFNGITNRENLIACLSQFDLTKTDDGLTVTQCFVSAKLGLNWKLSTIGPLIWSIFVEEYKKPLGLKSWPMEYFMSTIRILLCDHLSGYKREDQLEEFIHTSIQASGIEPCILDDVA